MEGGSGLFVSSCAFQLPQKIFVSWPAGAPTGRLSLSTAGRRFDARRLGGCRRVQGAGGVGGASFCMLRNQNNLPALSEESLLRRTSWLPIPQVAIFNFPQLKKNKTCRKNTSFFFFAQHYSVDSIDFQSINVADSYSKSLLTLPI